MSVPLVVVVAHFSCVFLRRRAGDEPSDSEHAEESDAASPERPLGLFGAKRFRGAEAALSARVGSRRRLFSADAEPGLSSRRSPDSEYDDEEFDDDPSELPDYPSSEDRDPSDRLSGLQLGGSREESVAGGTRSSAVPSQGTELHPAYAGVGLPDVPAESADLVGRPLARLELAAVAGPGLQSDDPSLSLPGQPEVVLALAASPGPRQVPAAPRPPPAVPSAAASAADPQAGPVVAAGPLSLPDPVRPGPLPGDADPRGDPPPVGPQAIGILTDVTDMHTFTFMVAYHLRESFRGQPPVLAGDPALGYGIFDDAAGLDGEV